MLCLCLFQMAMSQQLPRQKINFNYNWEMFRVDSSKKLKNIKTVRNSTSFSSQFNQESIKGDDNSPDSIKAREVKTAQTGFDSEYPKIKNLQWEKISLPHPARYEQQLNPGINQFTGICYYRKYFSIPVSYKQKHLYLYFEGAMQTASIWINGKYVTQHQGGYLPFTVQLDNYVNGGNKNEIIVRLDNRDNKNVPPGKPLATLGFLYWSGIYRNVWFIVTNPVHITDPIDANIVAGGGVFVRCENISPKSADLLIKTQIKNPLSYKTFSLTLKQILINPKNGMELRASASELKINSNSIKDITGNYRIVPGSLVARRAESLLT